METASRRQLIWATAMAAACLPAVAYADPPPPEEMQKAFFHVSVAGEPSADGPGIREGKAFAIGPNLIVTSRHIVGDEDEWKQKSDLDAEIARATTAADRTITLIPSDSGMPADLGDNALVSSQPDGGIDIAEVTLPDARFENYFGLSMCDIQAGRDYAVLLGTREPPDDPASVKRVAVVKLRATGYDVPNYGGLFAFDLVDDDSQVQWEANGHEGSPVFDEDGNVVGIVSAITLTGSGDHRILATPIGSPLLSAISAMDRGGVGPRGRSVKCSLADTVRRINEQVLAYARWTLEVPREPDGKPLGQLLLHYESVADYPNIASVIIEYEYWGKQRRGDETRTTRLQYPDDDVNELPLKGANDEKVFDASDVIDEGKRQLEKYLDDKREGGIIQHVEIRIIGTTLTDGREIKRVTALRFDWGQP